MTAKALFIATVLLAVAGCAGTDIDVRPVIGASEQGHVGDAASFLDQGKREFAADHFGLAIRQFRKALDIDPKSIRAMNGLAACYDMLGRFDVSAHLYRAALIQEPRSAATLNNLGYSYHLQKKPELAISYLHEAASHSATDAPLIRSNLRIVQAALEHAGRSVRTAGHGAMTNRRKDQKQESRRTSNRQKSVRLLRSGPATYTLYTSQPEAWPSGIPGGSGSNRAFPRRGAEKPAVASKLPFPPEQKELEFKLESRAVIVVANGTGRRRMASRMARHLTEKGYQIASLANANKFDKLVSRIFYRAGQEQAARALSASLFSIPRLVRREDQAATLHIELGADLLDFDRNLIHAYKKQSEGANHVEL